MNRHLTWPALVAATALTFSLASATAAQADGSSATLAPVTVTAASAAPTAVAPAAVAPAAVSAANPVELSAVTLSGGAGYLTIYGGSEVYAKTSVGLAVDPSVSYWWVFGDLYVNGALRASGVPIATKGYPHGPTSWSRTFGFGTAQFRNIRVDYTQDGVRGVAATPVVSNGVRVKRGVQVGISTGARGKVHKRGSKVTVKALNWRTYEANGSKKSLRKVKLQRYYKGKWRNYRNIKVNAAGRGKVVFKQKKKFKYRLYYPGNASIVRYTTSSTRRI